ncbi:LOW QUALITY PROTEIN: putative F-box protein At1g46984 [Quercus suber]|uniref:LOW QUALITY PROTEIN: putative F-box protein At1g46984 n=1 Tax=Quercus suber TaxID=58331 RepID=UPI0032DF0A82
MVNIFFKFTCCSSPRCLETSNEERTRIANKETKRAKPEIVVNKKNQEKISISATQQSIPLDIVMEILSWLPVTYVLRMKCVCKQWYTLTQDCHFIEKHMSRHRIKCSYNKIPITPPGNSQDNFQLICGCNGMLLKKRIASNKFLIMNSATRQMLELPDPHKNSFGMTFSFVPSTGCYKFVSIYDDNEETGNEGCEILTVGSDNSWRTINFPSQNDANKKREKIMVVSAGEAVHCIKINKVRTCFCAEMVSLDLESESFKSTICPKDCSQIEKVWALDWNGCLSFAVRVEEVINVIVLEDYKKLKCGKEKIVIPLAFTNSTPNLMEDLVPLFLF